MASWRYDAEQCLVQLLLPQSSVEALNDVILPQLPGRDVMPFNLRLIAPGQNGVAGEFGSIVAGNHRWFSAFEDEVAEFARHPKPESDVAATSDLAPGS